MIIRKTIIKDFTNNKKEYDLDEKSEEEIAEDGESWRKPKDYELESWMEEIRNPSEYKMEGFEGAIVLDPNPGIYLDDPVAVLDYASLYPSSIIEKNLSPETQVENIEDIEKIGYDNLNKVEYENFMFIGKGKGDSLQKIIDKDNPVKTCYFLKPEYMKKMDMGDKGIIPQVLENLLSARKETKEKIKTEPSEAKRKVLDGVQLAQKVTANSVYGQLGASTSTVFKMAIAACTTSIGRERIDDASNGVKKWAAHKGYEPPEIVYGDTDSVFVKFSRNVDGRTLKDKEALQHCIQCGIEAGDYITNGNLIKENKIIKHPSLLNHPQDLEYEKTFWPFILISKKRYTGDKYEFKPDDCKRTSMGIVLKRRDNAPIVKYVFGNVIEKIMIERDFESTLEWLKTTLNRIRKGEFPLRYFVITKSLRSNYKNPTAQPHKVLADRIAVRDPGNKPKANDRIPFAYIKLSNDVLFDKQNPYKSGSRKGQPRLRNILQGDRVEHVDYISEHNLPLDYEFYITNQIMNPVKQVLDLRLDSSITDKLFI
jgi:DNA polymerase elongation subunit (family B)